MTGRLPGAIRTAVTCRVDADERERLLDAAAHRVALLVPEGGTVRGLADGVRTVGWPAGGRAAIALSIPARAGGQVELTGLLLEPGSLDQGACRRALTAVDCLPLTDLEMTDLRAQMPLTSRLPDRCRPGALAGIAPVVAVHHMTDFCVLVETLIRLGVDPSSMTVIDKGYAYRHSRRVDAHLRRLGITVAGWRSIADALTRHTDQARDAGQQCLVIDDGGYCLPMLLDELPDRVDQFIGAVEQTTSGIARLARFGDRIPLPVFSVAQSRLKATIESYGIADAAVRNLLMLVPHEKWEGQPALVLGFGRIGQQVAQVLRDRRMRVAVHDAELAKLIAAHERGFVTGRSVHGLLAKHRPMLIVGATGHPSLHGDHLAALDRDTYLASVTSRTREFALDDFEEEVSGHSDLGLTGRRYRLPSRATATLVADGYPINFHGAESLANPYADVVLAALAIGALTLARPGHGFTPGHNVARTDTVLERCGLLDDYYTLHGPGIR